MNPFKTWLKKIILAVSAIPNFKRERSGFLYFMKKYITKPKGNLSSPIKKTPFFSSIRFESYLLRKSSFFYEKTGRALSKILDLICENKTFKLIIKSPVVSRIFKFFKQINQIPILNKILSFQQKKSLIFFPFAFAVSLFIFYFMSLLISGGKNSTGTDNQNISINFLLNAQLEDLELRSRRKPKKPKKEEPPPETPKLKIQQTEQLKPEMNSQLPQLDLPDDFQSDDTGARVSSYGSQDREVTPIFRINPIYPRLAALRNIEGFVILQFDITPAGHTDNITVIQASPTQIFNASAVQALQKWKYKAKIENGKAVRQKNLKVQLDFKLRNQ